MVSKSDSNHISTTEIEAYLANNLDEKAENQLEKHLLTCDFCADALEGTLAMDDAQISPSVKKSLSLRLQKRVKPKVKIRNLRLEHPIRIIALILVFTILGVFTILQFLKPKPIQGPKRVELTLPPLEESKIDSLKNEKIK